MGLTNFPNGVSSFGIPVIGGGGLTFPTGGKVWFVDPANGNDGHSGKTPATAFKTLSTAYGKTVSGRGDVIYLISDGSTTGTARLSSALTWSNNNTHLIGWCAPSMISQRARIAPTTTATQFTPMITISGSGCTFANVQIYSGFTTGVNAANTCVTLTGSRNYFSNCHIAGMGTDLAGDHASGCSLSMSASSENVFSHCTIGLDTAVRSAANSEIKFASACCRNIFEDCLILSYCDAAGHLFVDASAVGCIDRFVLFRNTQFVNAVASGSTTMTVGIDSHVSMGGAIILSGDTFMVGATDVSDQFTGIWGLTASGNGTYAQGVGLAVQVA